VVGGHQARDTGVEDITISSCFYFIHIALCVCYLHTMMECQTKISYQAETTHYQDIEMFLRFLPSKAKDLRLSLPSMRSG
jgi:hypothetical protein